MALAAQGIMIFYDELPVLDPTIFRECNGWEDAGGVIYKSIGHEQYFLIPALESIMPPHVPIRKRCDACVIDFRRYKKRCRVRRFRSSKFHVTRLQWWNNVLQMHADGKIRLSEEAIAKIKGEMQRNGG